MNLPGLGYIAARLWNWRASAVRNSHIDKKASIGAGAQIISSSIDRYSYVYGACLVNTSVGKFCSIASKCIVGGGKHPVNWVSTSPVFYQKKNVLKTCYAQKHFEEFAETRIGNDVWIGNTCLIKGGVTIGDGAIIGMGSVVTKDIPPYEIWAGAPAKCIRKRFDDETIARLLELKWWDWDEEMLHRYGEYFDDPARLLQKLEEDK